MARSRILRINRWWLVLAIAIPACAARPSIEVDDRTAIVESTLPSSPVSSVTPPSEAETGADRPPTSEPSPPTTEGPTLLAGGVDLATLTTSPEGDVLVQATPEPLVDRRLPTTPLLPAPDSDDFRFAISPLDDETAGRTTWNELCPTAPADLSYVTVSFWGFDGAHHTGELIVASSQAEGVVGVFERLHAIRFPIEEMRIVTPLDVVARRTGDGNNTASYVCRAVTGGTRFSEHATGLAVDINPFQNPYRKGNVIIPALASAYLDRENIRPGMIVRGDPMGDEVIAAFAEIGWEWGGDWTTLKDYQHFSLNNR